jgi:putative oxidoreductase
MPRLDTETAKDLGLLVARVGMGAMFVGHGWPKIAGGPEKWAKLGSAMSHLGIDVWPTMWGLAAAASEFGGGILLALGLLFRPAAGAMAFTMAVAAWMHHAKGDGFGGWSHALEACIVFLALVLTGPGRFALEVRLQRKP